MKSPQACEHCGAPIEWVVMRDGDQRSVDAVPVLAVDHTESAIVATRDESADLTDGVTLRGAVGDGRPAFAVYVPHSITCTFARQEGTPEQS